MWILVLNFCASVAKPLVAKSHELSLAYDEFSLQKLEPPLVLQEFINHGTTKFIVLFYNSFPVGLPLRGIQNKDILIISSFFLYLCVGGVLFKVYIVGEAIKVVRRYSLPDVSKYELSKSAGVYHFPRVSCAAASADEADLDPCVAGELILSERIDFSCILLWKLFAYTVYSVSYRPLKNYRLSLGFMVVKSLFLGARAGTLVGS